MIQRNTGTAEWRFLLSNGAPNPPGTLAALNHPFSPFPVGTDISGHFGNTFALPIVGNFDPPAAIGQIASQVDNTVASSGQGGVVIDLPAVDIDGNFLTYRAEIVPVNDPNGNSNSNAVPTSNQSTAKAAYVVDQALGLRTTGNLYENWGGLNEKWLQGDAGWYFITPNGDLYFWDGGSDLTTSTVIATFDSTYHADPASLYDAPDTRSVQEIAYQTDRSLGLKTIGDYYQDWGGLNEKWILSDSGQWYFVTPAGDLFRWGRVARPLDKPIGSQPLVGLLGQSECTARRAATHRNARQQPWPVSRFRQRWELRGELGGA